MTQQTIKRGIIKSTTGYLARLFIKPFMYSFPVVKNKELALLLRRELRDHRNDEDFKEWFIKRNLEIQEMLLRSRYDKIQSRG